MYRAPRSVSVAVFAGVFWCLAPAAAQQPPERADADHAGGAKKPDHPPADEERLSDEAELARVVSLVEAAKYEECDARLARLLDPKGPAPLKQVTIVETARLYHATCLVGLGKDQQADEPLRDALRQNPEMRAPDSLLFPARVVDRFLRVREAMISELRKKSQEEVARAQRQASAKQRQDNEQWARMLQLERLAREEVVIEQHSRLVASVPLGVGQFQNGNKALGWTFFATELALTAASITTTAVWANIKYKADQIVATTGQRPEASVNGRLRDWHVALTVSTYTLLGVAALGVLEAHVSFVPEVRHVRERQLPKAKAERKSLVLTPDLAIGSRDVTLGLRGAF